MEITDNKKIKVFEKKITDWKNKLIDLSRRNRLLNFKPTKVTTIKILDKSPSDIFKSLVVNKESFHFLPREKQLSIFDDENEQIDEYDTEFSEYKYDELQEKHTDLSLQTNLTQEKLQRNLKRIQFKATQLMEEQGYNILYLALGMLEWYESENSNIINKSPLIILPVDLRRRSINSKFKLYASEDDPFINPALQYKLNNDFDLSIIDLSDDYEEFNLQKYFSIINELIKKHSRWKISNETYLGLFSFAKFVMFKDLERYFDIFKNNKIIQALAGIGDENLNEGLGDYITAEELDIKRKPADLFQVLDADSSQQEAIEAIRSKRSIVIHGPPGTGKSQTITNLIAESLALGKKVLFVSEKMAALEVVYNRLKEVDLGEYCLEIHSRKANKLYVLNQLKDAYECNHPGTVKSLHYLDDLTEKRNHLNEYSALLHKSIEPFGKSTYWIIGQLNQLREIEIIPLPNFEKITFNDYLSIINTLKTLKERIKIIGNPSKHPFRSSKLDIINEFEQQKIKILLSDISDKFVNIKQSVQDLSSNIGNSIDTFDIANAYCKLLDILSETHTLPECLLDIKNIEQHINQMMPIFEEIKQYQENRGKIEEKYNKEIFDQNLQEIYQTLTKKHRFFWRIGSPKYYGIKKIFKTCSIEKKSFSYSELVSETNEILTNINLKEEIKSVPIERISPLGELWQDVETEINIVLFALEWLKKYQTSRVIEDDDNNLKKFILNSETIPKYLLDLKSTIENNIKELKKKKDLIDCALKIDNETVYPLGFDNTSIEHIHFLIETMHDNIHVLVDWTRYQRALKECGTFNLMKFIDELILKKFEPNNLILKFKRSFLFQLLQIILKQYPQLETFESLTHNQIIKKFQELDKSQFKLAQYRIKESLYNRKPDMNWEGTRNSKLGYLQRQFRLRRGIHPIRKIFSNVPDIVQKICPCFMMSPLSLAQYITPGIMEFDIVIFDEASQIEPENSLGAIIRGHQLVVAGDTKQLPPSAFFQKETLIAEDDDDEYSDELNTPALESILDECLTIGMKSFTLKWHYRSKHESLIHFSNKSFYNNELLTFPSPHPNSKDLGVSFVHVQDTIYERGGSGVNRKEAKEVAKAVLNHFRNNPKKSLGVGTFSIKQQIAIVDELDNLRRQDLSLEAFFTNSVNEPFFIKNLETIQGDERDVIFISVGYGRDANGKLAMHFGPLNKEGGERRLNVLITRAKEKIVVFSSITGDDFDLSKTQSIGVYKLKQYLDFAKLKRFDEDIDISCDFDENNPFECSVYKQLKAKGIKAIPQVGFAGYKIDFGILHPINPSKFILAVECDGANYHSSATARDRDRLRQEILEKKGWHFHRIWSTDWFLNPSSEMQRLLHAIEIAKNFSPAHFEDETPEIEIEQMDTDSSKNNFGIEIIPYQKYSISHMDGPDSFYSSFYKVKELILKIIKIESPIHIKELALRVIQHFEMNRVGNKINNKIKFFIEQMCNEHAVLYKSSFVYQINSPINIIRLRDCEDAITNIEFIPPEEITNAIMLVVKKEFSISLEELIPKTARLFGFQHTGKKIQNYIENDIKRLLKEKLLVESEYGIKENQQK